MQPNGIKEVILVDDEPGVLLALKMLLSALGYTVQAFGNPEEALQWLPQVNTPQVIISDLRMPKIDGIQLLIESKKIRPDIPFVLMSGHATKEDVDKATANGSRGFLAKPFTPDQVRSMISSL